MPDVALAVNAAAAKALADWYALGAAVIDKVLESYMAYEPSVLTIWPEHFDLAAEMGDKGGGTRANYVSPASTKPTPPGVIGMIANACATTYASSTSEGRTCAPNATRAATRAA